MVDGLRQKFGNSVCVANAPIDQSMGKYLNQDFQGSLKKLTQNYDVVVLGDTNHETLGTRWFVKNNVVEVLAKSGVKTLYLEVDANDQKKIDDFTSGKISADKFTEDVSSHYQGGESDLTNLISQAKKYGVKVIAADNAEAGKAAQKASKYSMLAEICGTDTEEGQQYLQKSYAARKERMGYDKNLAEKINETRGNEKAAVIFGANHGRTVDGLMNNLRGASAKLDIYGNTVEEKKETLEEDKAIGTLARKPDAVYIESQNTIYATCNTSPKLAEQLEFIGDGKKNQILADTKTIEPQAQNRM
jgi:hypothetical protein